MKALYGVICFSLLALIACRSSEHSNASSGGFTTASMGVERSETTATSVLKRYHKALIAGDSTTARSLATGTALSILEYRFYRSTSDDQMQFTYGAENIVRDTCYIPLRVRNGLTRDPETQGKAILVKVGGEWKVERIAMNK